MAMTYLQLAQRLRQEVGAAGTGPSSVTSQTGELGRIVAWIATADEDVARLHNEWKFMVGNFTLNTVANTQSYAAADCVTPVTDLRDWKSETLKMYLLATGVSDEARLTFMPYHDWYRIYNTGTQTAGRPVYFTIGNDMSIKLGPVPNGVYRVSGEYQKSATTMTLDAHTPAYPGEYHLISVYRAMMKYGRYTGATEVYQDGAAEYKRMLKEMERTQLPRFRLAEALA